MPNPVRKVQCLVYRMTLRLSMKEGGGAYETSYLNPANHASLILFRADERSYCDQNI